VSLTIDVVTLFPGAFFGVLADGVLGRARRAGRVSIRIHDLRRWGIGRQRQVDDAPYGGGGGMILRPEPLFAAVDWLRRHDPAEPGRVVLLSPHGARLDHAAARRLAGCRRLVLLCGRYEGVDARVASGLADEELSIGDLVVSGGELPALVVIDAVSRFVPGVLGQVGAAERESFADGLLESPYYTRPVEFRGLRVPEVLRSGDHAAIERWRARAAREATLEKRPDLVGPDGAGTARRGVER